MNPDSSQDIEEPEDSEEKKELKTIRERECEKLEKDRMRKL